MPSSSSSTLLERVGFRPRTPRFGRSPRPSSSRANTPGTLRIASLTVNTRDSVRISASSTLAEPGIESSRMRSPITVMTGSSPATSDGGASSARAAVAASSAVLTARPSSDEQCMNGWVASRPEEIAGRVDIGHWGFDGCGSVGRDFAECDYLLSMQIIRIRIKYYPQPKLRDLSWQASSALGLRPVPTPRVHPCPRSTSCPSSPCTK